MSHSRSTSRTRVYDVVERDELRIDTSQSMLSPTLSLPSRTRSCSTRRPSNDGRDCIPCNMVRPSSTLKKRLIVCCDGTFCAADKGKENNPTNITRLSRVIANTGLDSQGKYIPQIVNYQSGVGTGKLTKFNKDLQGAFGHGLTEKVCEAYTFLVNNYGPGDEIFIFGFSRGAYTARSLASFICQVGLLSMDMMDYFDPIFNAYKNRNRRAGENNFQDMEWAHQRVRPGELGFDPRRYDSTTRYDWIRKWAHLHVKVKVVGVFDTVGSLGMSGWVHQPGQDVDWHATKLHPKIEYAFHALALDESRGNFPPTMFFRDQACKDAGVKLRQCWFPGYHGNIGGESQAKYDLNSIDEMTFAWMIDQLTRYNLLAINKRALKYPILDRLSKDLPANSNNPIPPRNPQEVHERRIDWSDGKLVETDTLLWHIASEVATQRWEYVRKPGEYHAYDPKTRHRLDQDAFSETIHPSVWHRIQYRNYEPRSLPLNKWSRVRGPDGIGFEWIKSSKSGYVQVRIPEYVIPNIGTGDNAMDLWSGSLEQRIAPGEYLRKLDQANGVLRGQGRRPATPRVDSGGKRPGPERIDSGYGGDYDEYLSVKETTIRTSSPLPPSSPRPPSRIGGEASEYFDLSTPGL